MPRIYDNIKLNLTEGLNNILEVSQRADFCVGYFNLRGWKEVAEKIDTLFGEPVSEKNQSVHRICRLLVGMQKMPNDIIRSAYFQSEDESLDNLEAVKLKKRLAQEFKQQLTIGAPNAADEKALQQLARQLKEKKVTVKLHLSHTLHAKLYIAYDKKDKNVPIKAFLGSSNLTLSGLSKQGELNVDVFEQDAAEKLATWFDARWNDRWCIDITKELIEIIEESWAGEKLKLPYHHYLKIVYHLSQEARSGISEFNVPKIFEKRLLPFQAEAVKIAAKKLHERDGIMIGDVVGLGKTITACAIAKLFEEDFHYNTLIICPKNLKGMWEHYKHEYGLKAHIVSISNLKKELGKVAQYNFRQVIIDESHNLRNSEGSRYKQLKEFLDNNDGKLILLSATPYNKTYLDLSNQLRLFLSDDKDLGISPENYIKFLGGQAEFGAKHTETFIRSIKAFEKSEFSDDWRELMRLYLIRRTRSFIKNNYAETDAKNGRKYLEFYDKTRSYFPDRIPKKVEYEFNPNDVNDIYANLYSEEVVEIINELELPRYGLQKYLLDNPKIKANNRETILTLSLSRAGKRLMGFCRTNLFKRLESSGYSFLLSLSRHVLRNYLFIYALKNNLPIPIGKRISQNLDEYLEDDDLENENEGEENNTLNLILKEKTYLERAETLYKLYASEKYESRFDWIRSGFFKKSLAETLISDCRQIIEVMKIGENWQAKNDKQLNALYELLTEEHPEEKVLIFTQFADTAYYLTNELQKRGIENLEWVTGSSENPTESAHRFSPNSNNASKLAQEKGEIRVLITTDVLSEGQNLQDSHVILNYDLPWAIIRLIQRAGRVDRIGQKADKIYCYSFLPEDGIEKIIQLRARLTKRIDENANVVGSDEVFFEGDQINLQDLYTEKAGILDAEENEEDTEVDLASYCYQIWKSATDANPSLKKIIPALPNNSFATKKNEEGEEQEGVIVYSRTSDDNDMLTWVNRNGKIITQSQYAILKAAQCTPETKAYPRMEIHHELVQKGLDFIKEEGSATTGALGKKSSAKYQSYTRLKAYCANEYNTPVVTEQLKKAVEEILKYPFREFARETINRQLKLGINDDKLAELVVSLREEGKLVIVQEEDEQPNKDSQIICSLGLVNV
jgi:superfamily II DNA or RNA helicase